MSSISSKVALHQIRKTTRSLTILLEIHSDFSDGSFWGFSVLKNIKKMYKVVCPNEQVKSKQETDGEVNFEFFFDILTDMCLDIYTKTGFKVTPVISFVGTLSQREDCLRFY